MKYINSIYHSLRNLVRHFLRMSRTQQLTLVGIFAIAVIAIIMANRDSAIVKSENAQLRVVSLANVSTLSEETTPLEVSGRISSTNEAVIRSESGGQVRVYRKLGDNVSAGMVIAELENSGERAAVLQTEGVYETALVQLARAKGGARNEVKEISSISSTQAGQSLVEAKQNAVNTINSSYSTMDDAIRTKTDALFSNPSNRSIRFIVSSADSRLVSSIEATRSQFEIMLKDRYARNETLTAKDDLVTELSRTESELTKVRNYLDDVIYALNKGIPDPQASQAQIDGYKASASIARSSVIGQLAQITGAKENLNARLAQQSITEQQLAQTQQGDANDIMQAEAGVKQALGALRAAQSRLEKTIIRSPINGTINRLTIENGDYIAPYTEVAVVSNNGALEVVLNLTEDDVANINVGSAVLVGENTQGVVTKIAPALDPTTKKLEVRVGITRSTEALVNGSSVQVKIVRNTEKSSQVESKIQLPLSAVKITPNGSVVFSVNEEGILVAHPVTLGTLLGEKVEIQQGVTREQRIVVDARGLQEGMHVETK